MTGELSEREYHWLCRFPVGSWVSLSGVGVDYAVRHANEADAWKRAGTTGAVYLRTKDGLTRIMEKTMTFDVRKIHLMERMIELLESIDERLKILTATTSAHVVDARIDIGDCGLDNARGRVMRAFAKALDDV